MNNKTGFGLSKPLKINSYLEMFIHVKMPFSAQRYEQVTVYAVIYNFFAAETFVSCLLFSACKAYIIESLDFLFLT